MTRWPWLLLLLALVTTTGLVLFQSRESGTPHEGRTEIVAIESSAPSHESPTLRASPDAWGKPSGKTTPSKESQATGKGNTYFVYRSAYLPWGRQHHVTESCDSVLAWTQRNWETLTKEWGGTFSGIEGDVYGIPALSDEGEPDPKLPKTIEEAIAFMKKELYTNEVEGDNACVRVETDDDEIELAWFVFTDTYLKANPHMKFWITPELPLDGEADGGFKPLEGISLNRLPQEGGGEGTTYVVFASIWDGGNLSTMPAPIEIKNVRLPELLDYLIRHGEALGTTPDATRDKNGKLVDDDAETNVLELRLLAYLSQLRSVNSVEDLLRLFRKTSPKSALSDSRAVKGHWKSAHDLASKLFAEKTKSRVRVGDHFAQVAWWEGFAYDHCFIFDDRWATAHPELANGILRWGSGAGP